MNYDRALINLKLRRLPEQFLESVDLAYNRLYEAIRTAADVPREERKWYG